MSKTKDAVTEFVKGLDSTDKGRLKKVLVTGFDEYVTSVPGPDDFVKRFIKTDVEKAIENLINDWTS